MDRYAIIDEVIGVEGGCVDDPDDPGGATRWGVTERIARAHGYAGDMRNYPREDAVKAFEQEFWFRPRIDSIAKLNVSVAEEVFECGVNCSPQRAIRFLQSSLNALAPVASDIPVDGVCGEGTIQKLRSYLALRPKAEGISVLLKALNGLQCSHYLTLANERKQSRKFVYGWIRARVEL